VVDSQSLASRFEKLREYVKILEEIKRHARSQFLKDYHVYGLAERYLQLAIECLLDIGGMLIVQYGFRKPSVKQEIIEILEEEKVLPSDFTHRLAGIAGFRNILIHEYVKIDRARVYEYLQKNLPQFDLFLKHVSRYLKKHP
jgi:uncharacterized protein YutE (UPF0331/DUF86 family)